MSEDVRTYRGRSLAELLPQIREELGDEAVVLRRREGLAGGVGGFFAKAFVEVEARAGAPRIDVRIDEDEDEDEVVVPRAEALAPVDEALTAAAASAAAPPSSGFARLLADAYAGGFNAPADPAATFVPLSSGAAQVPDHVPVDVEREAMPALAAQENAAAYAAAPQAMPSVPVPPSDIVAERLAAAAAEVHATLAAEAAPAPPTSVAAALLAAAAEARFAVAPPAAPVSWAPAAPAEPVAVVAAPAPPAPAAPVVEAPAPPAPPAPVVAAPAPPAPPAPAAPVVERPAPVAPPAPAAPVVEAPAPVAPLVDPAARSRAAATAERRLVEAGLSPGFARQVVAEATSHGLPFATPRSFKRLVREAVARRLPVPEPRGERTVVAFVGAAGAGRTTVAGGLAAAYANGSDLDVRAIALGTTAHAAQLAAIAGPAAVHAETPADAAAAVAEAGDRAFVTVDGGPLRAKDAPAVRRLQRELRAAGATEVHLVLPATLSAPAARKLLEAARPLKPAGIVLTHVDEAAAGAVLELAATYGLPLSWQATAGSIGPADPTALSQELLP